MVGLNLTLPKKVEKKLEYLSSVSKRPKEFYVEEAVIRY
jgi:predicted DNA-binding protein